MNRSQARLGAQNEVSNLCICVGRAASAWVAQAPGGSLGPQVGRISLAGSFWRPFRCPNQACDSSLESYWSLLSKTSGSIQFGFELLCQ